MEIPTRVNLWPIHFPVIFSLLIFPQKNPPRRKILINDKYTSINTRGLVQIFFKFNTYLIKQAFKRFILLIKTKPLDLTDFFQIDNLLPKPKIPIKQAKTLFFVLFLISLFDVSISCNSDYKQRFVVSRFNKHFSPGAFLGSFQLHFLIRSNSCHQCKN